MEGKELPSGAHGSAGEVRAARVAGRAGWAGCARRGARECGPARAEGEAGGWAVREGVARVRAEHGVGKEEGSGWARKLGFAGKEKGEAGWDAGFCYGFSFSISYFLFQTLLKPN